MNIFVLSPIARQLFSEDQMKRIQSAGDLHISDNVGKIIDVPGLIEGNEDRILAIDPDSCNWNVSREDLEKIPNLKAIVLQTTSFSYVDVEYCKRRGIPVMNLPGFSTESVAEWAIMTTLCLARKIPLLIKDDWQLDFVKHQGYELRGKKAGIIGLGRIGKAIATRAHGLGMDISYWSQTSRDDRYAFVELSELMTTSDVLFMCLARNSDTAKLITNDHLRGMRKTAIFVRTGFAPNHELLLEMVKKGDLYGYGFDEDESSFATVEGNVWASPPNGWLTNESVQRNAEQWTNAIIDAANGTYTNTVN